MRERFSFSARRRAYRAVEFVLYVFLWPLWITKQCFFPSDRGVVAVSQKIIMPIASLGAMAIVVAFLMGSGISFPIGIGTTIVYISSGLVVWWSERKGYIFSPAELEKLGK
jgi:uncharacterized membrane protein YczE